MDAKNSRSEAEQYRQERKERIKKSAKKTSKGTGKAGSVIGKIVGWAIVAALVVGFVWFIADFFGWGPKLTTVATVTVGDAQHKIKQTEFNYYYTKMFESTAETQGVYAQYGLTGSYDFTQGPDAQTTKDEDGNEITYAEQFKKQAIESIEQIHYYADKAKAEGITLSEEDQKDYDEKIEQITTQTDKNGTKYSAGYVLVYTYGKGMNLSLYKKYLMESYLSKAYSDHINEINIENATEEEVNEKFEASPEDYQKIDLRIYGFKIESDTTDDEGNTVPAELTAEVQEARAKEMIGKVTDEASFLALIPEYCTPEEVEEFSDPDNSLVRGMDHATIAKNMSEDDAKWAFDSARKVGDTSVWTTSSYVYAVYVVKTAYKDMEAPATVRHILVKFPEEEHDHADETVAEPVVVEENVTAPAGEEGVTQAAVEAAAEVATEAVEAAAEPEETVPETHYDDGIAYLGAKHKNGEEETVYKKTPATKEETKEIAESYLAMYQAGEQTEESFAKLADLYSDDTSSTTAGGGDGGLIADITSGKTVKPFEDWAFAEGRKAGDVEIVETSFGYHIMYFVSRGKYAGWEKSVREAIAAEKTEEDQETQKEEYTGSLVEASSMEKAVKKMVDHVMVLSAGYASSLSSGN